MRTLFHKAVFSLLTACFLLAMVIDAVAQAPLTIEQRRDIRFGTIAADGELPGTVVLSPTSDTTTFTGPLVDFGGTVRRGRFRIEGEPRAFVNVILPTSITIERGTSGNAMTVDSFTMDRDNPVRLNNRGIRTINIGATLRVGIDQRRGNYNDNNIFDVTVEYD